MIKTCTSKVTEILRKFLQRPQQPSTNQHNAPDPGFYADKNQGLIKGTYFMTNLYFQGGIKKEVAKLPSSFRPLKTTISQTKKEQLTTLQFFWRCAWIAPARSEFWAVRHSLCTLTFLGPVLKDGSPLASLEEKLWTSQNILTNTQNR